MTLEYRFRIKFSVIDSSCWIWKAGKNKNGYGWFRLSNRPQLAHRLSMHIYRGFDLNSPELVLHKNECNNKLCVNPDHLYIGRNSDNMDDLLKSGNHNQLKKTHCPQGHEYTERNTLYYNGWRRCRICHREKEEERRNQKTT